VYKIVTVHYSHSLVSDSRTSQQLVYKGTLDAVHKIWNIEGWRGLYQGLSPNLIGATVSWGSYFFLYEMVKRQLLLRKDLSQTKLGPLDHMAAAAMSGALTTTLTNPIWVVKTRMCADLATTPIEQKYRGLLHGLIRILRLEGFRGWYKGIIPSLFGVSHGVFQFVAYEELKSFLYAYHGFQHVDKLVSVMMCL
jgi:solute carrier family 25 (mitochondrial folate transporter), member 32